MITTQQQAIYGGQASPTSLRGFGFRLRPNDGCAQFPVTVDLDGSPYQVDGTGWVPTGASRLAISPPSAPAPLVYAEPSASALWDVVIAENACDLERDPGRIALPARQLLWSLDSVQPVGVSWGPVIDTTPFDAVRVLFAGQANLSAASINPIEVGDENWPVGAFASGQQLLLQVGSNACDYMAIRNLVASVNGPVSGLQWIGTAFDVWRIAWQISTAPAMVHGRIYGVRFGGSR